LNIWVYFMARGRKPELVTDGKFASLPLHDEPQSIHYARAQALRPDDLLMESELKVWVVPTVTDEEAATPKPQQQ